MGIFNKSERISSIDEDTLDDYRVRKWTARLNLQPKEIEKIYISIFLRYMEEENQIKNSDFAKWLNESSDNEVVRCMIGFITPEKDNSITFGELLEIICTFCRFTHRQMLIFLFKDLDIHKQNFIQIDHLKQYLKKSHDGGSEMQIKMGLQFLSSIIKGGLVSFEEMEEMDTKYPYLFYPTFRPQITLIKQTFGSQFWRIKSEMVMDEDAIAARMRRLSGEDDNNNHDDDDDDDPGSTAKVKLRMGAWYYITPWRRDKNRWQLLRMAAISAEIDALIDAEWRVTHPQWLKDEEEEDDDKDKEDKVDKEVGVGDDNADVKAVKEALLKQSNSTLSSSSLAKMSNNDTDDDIIKKHATVHQALGGNKISMDNDEDEDFNSDDFDEEGVDVYS